MSVKTETKGQENVDRIMQEIQKLKGSYVTIGFYEDAGKYPGGQSVVEVALWNEFGTSTSPERSFFRSAVDENMSQLNAWREDFLNRIVRGEMTVEKALETVGMRIQIMIQNKIKSNVPPPYGTGMGNPPERVLELQEAKRRKGYSTETLRATELMLRSVTYKVHMA